MMNQLSEWSNLLRSQLKADWDTDRVQDRLDFATCSLTLSRKRSFGGEKTQEVYFYFRSELHL